MKDVGDFLERLGKTIGKIDGPRSWDWGRDDDEGDEGGAAVERELDLSDGGEIEVEINASALSLRVTPLEPGQKPKIGLRGKGAESADLQVEQTGNKVKVSVQRARELMGWASHLRLTAALPADARVRVRLNAGRLRIAGMHDGEMDIRADASSVAIRDCNGRLRLATNAGKVDIDGYTGVLDARADAGAINLRDVHLDGDSVLRSNAGAIRGERLRLDRGDYKIETNAGSVRVGLLAGEPIAVDASASLGSVSNSITSAGSDAPVKLRVRTDLGSVRLYYDESSATPLRSVPVIDDRDDGAHDGEDAATPRAAAAQSIPFDGGEQPVQPSAPSGGGDETLRILAMVERHEITPGEAAALLAALRDRQA
jgi:hypothetical protein